MPTPTTEGETPLTDGVIAQMDSLPVMAGDRIMREHARCLERQLTALTAANAEMKKQFKQCAKERKQLIEGCAYADGAVGNFRDKYFDEDPGEGSMGSPEFRELNELQAHLAGTAIDNEGEFMSRTKYDSLHQSAPRAGEEK